MTDHGQDPILTELKKIATEQGISLDFRKHVKYGEIIYYPVTKALSIDETSWKKAILTAKLPLSIQRNTEKITFSHPRGEVSPQLYFCHLTMQQQISRCKLIIQASALAVLTTFVFLMAYIKTPV